MSNIQRLINITKQYIQGLNKEEREKEEETSELIHLEYWKSSSLARCPHMNHKIELIIGEEACILCPYIPPGINFHVIHNQKLHFYIFYQF